MNTKQFAFIICTNNEQYYNECVRYIQDLYVPEGYDIDIISIKEAESMAQGYNAGMQASDAIYKVYLHQDTFILNRNLLYDILRIFKQDENIGMIGVLGARELPKDANCYLKWDTGAVDAYNGKTVTSLNSNEETEYVQVQAVDGLIMITQTDVPWREDFLDGWDFYDVSQSLEMNKSGYKVVVPYQEKPWCYHDCGMSKLGKYHFYRRRVIEEYPQYFMESGKEGNLKEENSEEERLRQKEIEELRSTMMQLIAAGAYEQLSEISDAVREFTIEDTSIIEIVNLMEIYYLEKTSSGSNLSEWWSLRNWERIYEYYRWVRFVLLRIGYNREDERIDEVKMLVREGRITSDAVRNIAIATLGNTDNVYSSLLYLGREEPLVSVIILVYNGEDFVGDTIQSVLNQTYQNMEIIILDDASTDRSREVISSFEDTRIRTIFCEKNNNVCYTGNIGFQEARGKYVALIGHDDLWKPDKLEKQVAFMEEHPAYSVCFTWVDVIDDEGNIANEKYGNIYEGFRVDNGTVNRWLRKLFLQGNSFCAPSVCIRKALLEKTGGYRYALLQLQDYDLWLRIFLLGPVFILKEKLTCYRRFSKRDQNLSLANESTMMRTTLEYQCIRENWLNHLTTKQFLGIFGNSLRNPNMHTEKEILCEKAFLLWNAGNAFMRNPFAIQKFIELFEDEECRMILADRYHFSLQDFYEMSGEWIQ